MDAEGQAAEYPEPEKIQLSIPDAGGFENAVQQPGDGDGKTAFLKNSLTASVLVIGGTSIPASHYTDKIRPRPGAFEKSGKAHNPTYSSS